MLFRSTESERYSMPRSSPSFNSLWSREAAEVGRNSTRSRAFTWFISRVDRASALLRVES